MTKARLEFDLKDNDDQYEFHVATKATSMALSLWELDNWLRDQVKYHERDELQDVRDKLHEFLDVNGLNLEDLMRS